MSALLSVEGLERRFGGVRAVAPRSSSAAAGSMRSRAPSDARRARCWPTSTLSRAERSENSRMFWKVRATPRRAMTCGRSAWMGCPSRRMAPPVGASSPDTMLMTVVFPAPFGPMSPWISPRSTAKLAPSTARTPPNARSSRSTSRSALMPGPPAARGAAP